MGERQANGQIGGLGQSPCVSDGCLTPLRPLVRKPEALQADRQDALRQQGVRPGPMDGQPFRTRIVDRQQILQMRSGHSEATGEQNALAGGTVPKNHSRRIVSLLA